MSRVGQNRAYTLYTTIYLVVSLSIIPYIHVNTYMVLANPVYDQFDIIILSAVTKGV